MLDRMFWRFLCPFNRYFYNIKVSQKPSSDVFTHLAVQFINRHHGYLTRLPSQTFSYRCKKSLLPQEEVWGKMRILIVKMACLTLGYLHVGLSRRVVSQRTLVLALREFTWFARGVETQNTVLSVSTRGTFPGHLKG
jgi:hypothetical protein